MKTIKYRSTGPDVRFLEEILEKKGYTVVVSDYFSKDTDAAVRDFQQKNSLVVDGIVGLKTWSKLLESEKDILRHNDKLLAEQDLVDFAQYYGLELAAVKAVNEVESSGRGFLVDGRPKILFEGHVFWKELTKRGIDPQQFLSSRTANVLYKNWTKKYYVGGAGEYHRLEKAAGMSDLQEVHDAAYSAASWGTFQVMGYHAQSLGYMSVDHFVATHYEHEREHLKAFGKYLEVNHLINAIKNKDWAAFAKGYNGPGYKENRYDEKLLKAYSRYK
ncbi:N-acetylmuramidase domain-containing protein [Sinomicrobium sp. M5D2P9]